MILTIDRISGLGCNVLEAGSFVVDGSVHFEVGIGGFVVDIVNYGVDAVDGVDDFDTAEGDIVEGGSYMVVGSPDLLKMWKRNSSY